MALPFLWVSGIKEAYKGLLNGDILEGVNNSMLKRFIGIFIAILLVVFRLTLSLSKQITNPLVALKRGSEAIGGGDLDHRVEVKTGDELEDLANSFNKMASNLKR